MTLYDLGLRVPLIIRGPGVASGIDSDALVSELDLLPTLIELIERHCGKRLTFNKKWGNRVYAETIRRKDEFPQPYRILCEMDPQNLDGQVPEIELYDLQNDPDEMNNLAASPDHSENRERLMAGLRAWAAQTGDTAIKP